MTEVRNRKRWCLALGVLACLCVLIGGCVSKPVPLEQRVQERWNALVAGDFARAYAYLSPGYRDAVTEEQYVQLQRSRTVQWTGASFREARCEEADLCRVFVNLGYRVNTPVPGLDEYASQRVVGEDWIKTDETWFVVPEKAL